MSTIDRACCHCREAMTSDTDFFRASSGDRVWTHFDCMIKAGKRHIVSGAADEVRMAVDWGDGTAAIATGKQLREKR
jgi:hypothetical protein